MTPNVETKFKNLNLSLVGEFDRTGGVHHPVLPLNRRTEDQIVGFECWFFDSLHHTTPLHPTNLPSTPITHGSQPKRRGDHRHPGSTAHCGHAALPRPWRRPPRRLASLTPHPITPPLPSAAAGRPQHCPEPPLACPCPRQSASRAVDRKSVV